MYQPHKRLTSILTKRVTSPQRFLVTLSQQQSGVGAALDAGSALLAGGALAADEAGEVRLQLRLLAARWDALRTAALQRQRDLQAALHRLQNDNRDKFRYDNNNYDGSLRR